MSFVLPGRLRLALLVVMICVVPLAAACGRLGLGAQATPPTATAVPAAPTNAPAATQPAPTPIPATSPTATAPSPTVAAPTATTTTSITGLQDTVDKYVQSWHDGKFADMYGLLSTSAQASITQDKFVGRYT